MTRRACLLLCPALLLTAAAPVHAQRQSKESLVAIDSWVRAVNEHVPGRPDAALAHVAGLTYSARRLLNTSYSLFIKVLTEREVVITQSEIDKAVTRLARTLRADRGTAAFLKRAAVLHSDALVFARRFPRPRDDAPPPVSNTQTLDGVGRVRIPSPTPPALLRNERVLLTRDGQVIGDVPADWHLPFARSLLGELFRPQPHAFGTAPQPCSDDVADAVRRSGRSPETCTVVAGEPFVASADDIDFAAEWYHVVSAYLFAQGMNGDSPPHLQDAARVLPGDPRVLFDRGTFAETLGLPIYQAVRPQISGRRTTFAVNLPSEEKTNADAERLFRRVLQMNPAYHEARVRLARLLDVQGKRDEAAIEIAQVLDKERAGVVGFYALTLAGRIAAGRGRYAEALALYREAAALHPAAQSALLGASQAALLLADLPGALEPVAQLDSQSAATDADPWLDYQLGAGRDVETLLNALWARARK